MKHIKSSTILFLFLAMFCFKHNIKTHPYKLPFNKVVIWGHPLHSHTHSYIHYAYYRTFKHLGYETYWLNNSSNITNIDFSNSLFITEGQVDQKIPLNDTSFYILHNINPQKYKDLFDKKQCIIMQVYTHDCIPRDLQKMDDFILYNVKEQIIYMPWGTDLLPHEIDEIKQKMPFAKSSQAYFVGSMQGGSFSNANAMNGFKQACHNNGITWKLVSRVSPEENINLIQTSLLAPALQGDWQVRQGYIPCRIFKNISYGALGITNSKTVSELFKGKIVYHPDANQLCNLALERSKTITLSELHEVMDFVRDKHTYVSRIESLLQFFEMVYNQKQ